jgi:hypothetical protein
MQTRDRLHALIDDLPEGELPAVERFLVERGAPNAPFPPALANAPEDDEPVTPEEEAAIQEGLDAIARGDVAPQSKVRRALGR